MIGHGVSSRSSHSERGADDVGGEVVHPFLDLQLVFVEIEREVGHDPIPMTSKLRAVIQHTSRPVNDESRAARHDMRQARRARVRWTSAHVVSITRTGDGFGRGNVGEANGPGGDDGSGGVRRGRALGVRRVHTNGTEYHPLTFPVRETVHYFDDFGGVRQHPGNDLMGAKLDHELAANDGTITFVRSDSSGHSGNMLILTGTDGWKYWYIHVNNDTPGTDDGLNPAQWRFAPGIAEGVHVKRGQFIAYMGDSGEPRRPIPTCTSNCTGPTTRSSIPTHRCDSRRARVRTDCARTRRTGRASECGGRSGLLDTAANGTVLAFGSCPRSPMHRHRRPATRTSRSPRHVGQTVLDRRRAGDVRAFGDAHDYGGADRLR